MTTLRAAALHLLAGTSPHEVTQSLGSTSEDVGAPPSNAEGRRSEQILHQPPVEECTDFEGSASDARGSSISLELPPEIERRTVRKPSEADVVERDANRRSMNRAAATRANARRSFVIKQLEREDNRVVELERRRLALVREGEDLRRKVADMFSGVPCGERDESA